MADENPIIKQVVAELQDLSDDDLNSVRWYMLWLQCTPEERLEMTLLMLERVESRRADSPFEVLDSTSESIDQEALATLDEVWRHANSSQCPRTHSSH